MTYITLTLDKLSKKYTTTFCIEHDVASCSGYLKLLLFTLYALKKTKQ